MDEIDEMNLGLVGCRRCPRLVAWREKVAREKRRAFRDEAYWGKPVPGFGDHRARVFVVGLAPGAHGSNRTGRQFTGDASGDFLFPALYRAGFASQERSLGREDGMALINMYMAPVCRCAPPDNKPTGEEIRNCRPYLEQEFEFVRPQVLVALGRVAFEGILDRLGEEPMGEGKLARKEMIFGHNLAYPAGGGRWLVASYHPSRQNTQTGRLNEAMFDAVWTRVRGLLDRENLEEEN